MFRCFYLNCLWRRHKNSLKFSVYLQMGSTQLKVWIEIWYRINGTHIFSCRVYVRFSKFYESAHFKEKKYPAQIKDQIFPQQPISVALSGRSPWGEGGSRHHKESYTRQWQLPIWLWSLPNWDRTEIQYSPTVLSQIFQQVSSLNGVAQKFISGLTYRGRRAPGH